MTKTPELSGVPFLDLKRQYAGIQQELEAAVLETLRSGQYILGPRVEAFEKEVAAACGAEHGLAVSSGSDALLIALMARGIGPGDQVITSPFTFFATAGAIHRVGARPVFVDIQADSFNIDPAGVEAAITDRTRALMPVHLFGLCADMDPLLDIAGRRGLIVIEDAAQAIGGEYKGRRAGSMGDYGCFSFFPSKNLGCMGDAGLVTTNSEESARHLRTLRDHGMAPRYHHRYVGGNFRCDALQAAILRVKLPHLDSWNESRRANARLYRELLAPLKDVLSCPEEEPQDRHAYHQFTLRVKGGRRDHAANHLRSQNIGCQTYYPLALHLQTCFEYLGYASGDFPVSEAACREVISLPIFPELTEEEIRRVVLAITQALGD